MSTQYMHAPSQSYGPQSFNANESHGNSGRNGNFAFKKRFEHIDWRKIASIDIDQISRTLDFTALQENVMNLTFCNIESELDMRMVDPNFVKLFKLAQFTIEYLLHSQDYLAEMVKGSEEKVHNAEQEMQKVREEMEKLKLELTETKKESHKRKKLLIAQQQMMHAGADSYHKCPFCSKAFLNISFLQAHIFRRHNEYSSKASSSDGVHASSGTSLNKTLEAELVHIKERLQMTEAALKEEKRMNRSLTKSLKEGDHQALVDISRDIHQDRLQEEEMQREIEEMKNKYEGAIRDLNQQLQSSERALVQLKNGRRSNLGSLEDDDDDDEFNRRSSSRKSQEVSNLQEELRFMKEQMEKQDRKWSKKFHEASETKNKLMDALEKTDKNLSTSQQFKSPETEKQHRENENILRKSREEEEFMKKMEDEITRRNEEQNRINNLKKQNRKERHVITTKETVVETFDKRTRQPGLHTSPPRRSPSPRRDVVHRMEPSEDEDDTELGTGTGSMLTSAKRTGTLGSTQGSYGNRSLKTMDFVNHLRNNPTLDILKKEILERLDERLESIGVNPRSEGITDYVCDNKLAMLKTQRNALEKKHYEFARIRQKVDAESTAEAKRRYKELRHSPPMDTQHTSPTIRRTIPQASQLYQSPHPTQHTVANPSPRPRSAVHQPVPTPRSNKTLQSTGSTTEWTSTQWDSAEDTEEDSREDPIYSSPHNRTPNTAPRLIVSKPLTDSKLDDDWDSDSESLRPAVAQPRVIMSKPRGENVSKLSQEIESQLNNRSGTKKLAGAVNTFNSNDVFDDDEFDSDEDIKPKARRPPTRASTEYSTNTYDTSQWGSSSKVASTVPPETKRSGSKSSFVSVTDVSSDEDLNTENI